MTYVLAFHIFLSCFMCGICWFVQIVHYPLFKVIVPETLPKYIKDNFRTAWIVGPVMVLELGSGLFLLYESYNIFFLINALWLGIIWLSTAAIQMPLHKKLARDADQKYLRLLVNTNWIRTVFWSLRCGLLFYYIMRFAHLDSIG